MKSVLLCQATVFSNFNLVLDKFESRFCLDLVHFLTSFTSVLVNFSPNLHSFWSKFGPVLRDWLTPTNQEPPMKLMQEESCLCFCGDCGRTFRMSFSSSHSLKKCFSVCHCCSDGDGSWGTFTKVQYQNSKSKNTKISYSKRVKSSSDFTQVHTFTGTFPRRSGICSTRTRIC